MKHYLSKLLLALALSASTVSCLMVSIDDDPNQKEQAKVVAKQYLTAFFNADKTKALEVSAVPFYADGDIFSSFKIYEKELAKELDRQRPKSFEITKLTFHSVEDLAAFNQRIMQKIDKKGFKLSDDIYLISAFINLNGRKDQGFLLVKKEASGWKVVGILD